MYVVFMGTYMLLGVCSMCHISLMAFDRAMAIKKPIFHRIHMKTRNAVLKLLIFTWLLVTLITAANTVVAVFLDSRYKYINFFTGIALPFLSTVVCYIFVFIAIRQRNEQFSHIASNSNASNSTIINEKRILKMILCVLAVYILCWLPFATTIGIDSNLFSSGEYQVFYHVLSFTAEVLHFMNSTCNPFLYAIFYPSYRRGVRDVLKRCFCRKDNSVASEVTPPQRIDVTKL